VPWQHRKSTRTRNLVIATCALGALGAGFAGIASAQTTHHRTQPVAQAVPRLGSATRVADISRGHRPHHRHPRPVPTSATPSTVPPVTTAPTTVPTTAAPTTKPPVTVPATTPPAPPSSDAVIDAVLSHINAARAANGLQAYALSKDLSKASQAHNALMVAGCGLSHQCSGEAGLGNRFTAVGVSWTSAGENIGQGNAQNDAASIIAAANGLTDLMLAEKAPNDGHRKNLLNSGFKHVGLAVTRGSDGRVWFTQDFVN
jgi:uncharacterized protein YkwD